MQEGRLTHRWCDADLRGGSGRFEATVMRALGEEG
jgi:hypothetical protein